MLCCVVLFAYANLSTLSAISVEKSIADKSPADLRLLNTSVFGKRTTDAVVLLQPEQPGTLDPETVMVDVSKGQYYAATIRYPKDMTFEAVRQSLNRAYGKWEKETFASDPEMGMWRNEDEKFSIQLTEDAFTIVVIYIKFEMVSDREMLRGISRATKVMEDEDRARKVVSEMRDVLAKEDFKKFYQTHCHPQLSGRLTEDKFIAFMRSDRGKELTTLILKVDDALQQNKGQDVLFSQYNERDPEKYEFILMPAPGEASNGQQSRLKLRKEKDNWKLEELD